MMQQHKYNLLAGAVIVLALLFASCEKEITVDLPTPEQKIVVEGYIFEGERPFVLLSHNSAYFAPIDSTALANSVIYDAVVVVSDGTNVDTLTFQNANESPLKVAYVKNGPGVIGQAGKTYSLLVIADGDTVTSTTTIIETPPIDSLQWTVFQDPADSFGLVWTYFKDPGIDERGYRLFSRRVSQKAKRNDRIFRPNTLISNMAFKGQNILFGVGRPDKYADGMSEDKFDHADKKRYRLGDTVKVRVCSVDLPAYYFFRSIENSMDNGNSPFSGPNNVLTNIKGGLGCWVGYGVSEKQVTCWPN